MNANGISIRLSWLMMATQALGLPDAASLYLHAYKAMKEENQPSLESKGESLTNASRAK